MGQQQLLLLVLGIVIVGIAIVVGIATYSENSIKSNYDALLQESLKIANDIQAWQQKPEMFNGSPDLDKQTPATFFQNADFVVLGYDVNAMANDDCYTSLNGTYSMDATAGNQVTIVAGSVNHQNQVTTVVAGSTQQDVFTCRANASASIGTGLCIRGGVDLGDSSPNNNVAVPCP